MSNVDTVTPKRVAAWAASMVEGWLPGYTDVVEPSGQQYRIVRLTNEDEPDALIFAVETVDGAERAVFQVFISAARVPDVG